MEVEGGKEGENPEAGKTRDQKTLRGPGVGVQMEDGQSEVEVESQLQLDFRAK